MNGFLEIFNKSPLIDFEILRILLILLVETQSNHGALYTHVDSLILWLNILETVRLIPRNEKCKV